MSTIKRRNGGDLHRRGGDLLTMTRRNGGDLLNVHCEAWEFTSNGWGFIP